jgi:hypothetical protein
VLVTECCGLRAIHSTIQLRLTLLNLDKLQILFPAFIQREITASVLVLKWYISVLNEKGTHLLENLFVDGRKKLKLILEE